MNINAKKFTICKNQLYFKFVFIKNISLGDSCWVLRTVSIVDTDVLVFYHPYLTQTKTKWLPCEFPFKRLIFLIYSMDQE